MSVKPFFETYRYTGEIARLFSQSIVECRLPGSEIGNILAVQAKAVPMECVCADGEVRYGGKLFLCVVYEDGDRRICRAERGAEFSHKAEGHAVTPACFAKVAFRVENITHRREGSGLYVSVIVNAEADVYGGKQLDYLVGGEDMSVKKDSISLCKTVCVSGESEGEDEFETEAGDVLLHDETAVVTACTVRAGQIEVQGELCLGVCMLCENETVRSYERLIPFSVVVPCEEAFGRVGASARVRVRSAHLTAGVDEDAGKCRIVFSYTVATDCFLHAKEELSVALDAFSPKYELEVRSAKDGGRYLTNQVKCAERVSGLAVLTPLVDGEYTLVGAVLPRAEIVCKKSEVGFEAEGAVRAEVLLRGAEGGYKTCTLQLPFVFPVDAVGEEVEADCIVCGLNIRRKKDGETEAEATLKICLRVYERAEWAYIKEVVEGEEIRESDAAFSVYIPQAGEDLWQVAKRLHRDEKELKKSNPELEFPVKEGQRIFVYRQIK
ncbi:MAG: hypothetical protein IJB34_01610 [Clostridia bacterium]|nr:hypothetical protein [Clostridia bacterium]